MVAVEVLRAELEDWCAGYIDAFMVFDGAKIAEFWAFPATVSQSGRIFLFKDETAFAGNTQKLCGFYQREGVVKAERTVLEVLALGPDTASMRVADVMYDRTGEALAQWEAGYTLQRLDGGWKAVFAVADGETENWAARGTPLGH